MENEKFINVNGDVYLREVREDDLEVMKKWVNNENITKNMIMGCVPGSSPIYCDWDDVYTDYERLLKSRNDVIFSICNKIGLVIGIVGLYNIGWIAHSAEFRIVIGDTKNLSLGIGTSVTREVVRYAFEKLNLHKVHLGCNAEDKRANKCYQKVGFVKEGTIRDYNFRNGRYYDANIYSILEKELK